MSFTYSKDNATCFLTDKQQYIVIKNTLLYLHVTTESTKLVKIVATFCLISRSLLIVFPSAT